MKKETKASPPLVDRGMKDIDFNLLFPKPTENEVRAIYKKAFGKEYDSPDRKQFPLPMHIAYAVAVTKIAKEYNSPINQAKP